MTTEQVEAEPAGFWRWLTTYEKWPIFDRLLFLLYGVRIVAVIHTVAQLNIADLLRERPRTVAELAEATGTHEQTLGRLLRAAAAIEVFAELPDGRFVLTPQAESLCTAEGFSLRDLTLLNGGELMTKPYAELLHTVRTGEPSFDKVFGAPLYDYFDREPEAGDLFDRSMVQRSYLIAVNLLDKTDFSRFGRIADIGGGRGHFLGELLQRHPETTALLFEKASVLAKAQPLLEHYGVGDRVETAEGDFFQQVPEGYDAYVLNTVLNGFDDEKAARILAQVRRAIGDNADARLFICEKVVVHTTNKWDYSKLIDLDMLVLSGGRERTLDEWRALVAQEGFELVERSGSSDSPWTALECRPRS